MTNLAGTPIEPDALRGRNDGVASTCPKEETPILSVCKASFAYREGREILNEVSLDLAPTDFVCLMGANGSGKTTLALQANALLLPSSGTVYVGGLDTRDASCTHLIRSTAAMVFQNPDDQLVNSIVFDDVAFGPENLGLEPEQIEQRVSKSLAQAGLAEFANRDVCTLSGGQKQRLALADALAMEPSLLILDEATSMLDPRSRAELMSLCAKLNEQGCAILMITHFPDEALAAKRLVLMDKGRIVASGAPKDVFGKRSLIEELGLDVPLAFKVTDCLSEAGIVSEREHSTISTTDSLVSTVAAAWKRQSIASNCVSEAAATSPANVPSTPNHTGEMPAQNHATSAYDTRTAQGSEAIHSRTKELGEALIELDRVSFTYDEQAWRAAQKQARRTRKNHGHSLQNAPVQPDSGITWALDQVCLQVREGEVAGIAGASGSGKSTLLKCLARLIIPSCGTMHAAGAAEDRSRVGILFQYPEHQLFASSVMEDVSFGPKNLGLSQEEAHQRAYTALELVGLDPKEFGARSPFALSQGEQRRVCLAGILAMQPQVLVLDEPFAGLDPKNQEKLMELFELLNSTGTTIVVASHDMDALARWCQRIHVMDAGRIVLSGTPDQVFSPENATTIRELGLDLPPVRELELYLAQAGIPLKEMRGFGVQDLVEGLVNAFSPCP